MQNKEFFYTKKQMQASITHAVNSEEISMAILCPAQGRDYPNMIASGKEAGAPHVTLGLCTKSKKSP